MSVSRATPQNERTAGAVVFLVLLVVYGATLAPEVTLWDAGEFQSAIATLGIPHPPGTPLYILIARVWSEVLGFVPQAAAVNALSAMATAAACAILARLMARWTENVASGIAAGLAAGAMFAVWQNATETEVYALSMLLGVLMVAAGERARRTGHTRDRALVVWLIALAIPLQISALVAAPAAVLLAALHGPRLSWPVLAALGGATALAMGIGTVSPLLVATGVVMLAGAALARKREDRVGYAEAAAYAGLVLLAASATLFMLVRAPFDPGINQGNPSTWTAFVDVIGRAQYDVPGLWPRRAPFWLQLANLFQYADWQVAVGLDDSVAASWRRTPLTVAFAVLAAIGARAHWRRHQPSARVVALLLAAASLGVVLVLNLRAGPSIGIGVLPPGALHEARERDYFFALAFAVAAAWAGHGAVVAAARAGTRRVWAGVAMAALPILLNVGAANRRRQPDASLASVLGRSLLDSAPPDAVLLLAGDNDTYAVWYQQRVHRHRLDVTAIVIPLLAAEWYRDELRRRDALLDSVLVEAWRGDPETLRAIADAAHEHGRPLTASVAVPRVERLMASDTWQLAGMTYVAVRQSPRSGVDDWAYADGLDPEVTSRIARSIEASVPGLERDARDATGRYVQRLLRCPAQALDVHARRETPAAVLLDSRCNLK